MKILILIISLLHQNDVLMKQGNSEVALADLDAYVYLLPVDSRAGFINDNQKIEKNLITILNMNIIHDYVVNSGLIDKPAFEKVSKLVEEKELVLDDEFYTKLGLDKISAESAVRQFIEKQEYYSRMLLYLKDDILDGKIEQLAKEYFLVNKSQWIIPEKRDLSVILIKSDSEHYDKIENVMKQLVENPNRENFRKQALKYSDDPSVKLNEGDLSLFTREGYNMPFTDTVFNAEIGVIPSAFKYKNNYYLIRVNEIVPEKKPLYADYADHIKEGMIDELVKKKFQNIINEQAAHKIEINPEVMAHAFERYKVLIVD